VTALHLVIAQHLSEIDENYTVWSAGLAITSQGKDESHSEYKVESINEALSIMSSMVKNVQKK